MDEVEQAFSDALRRVDSVTVPVRPLDPEELAAMDGSSRIGPGRPKAVPWVAAAAAVALVAALSVWALLGRGGVPAVPAGSPSAPTPSVATPMPATTVQVRIRNDTGADFEKVLVSFPYGTRVDYGPLARGAASEYHSTELAYSYSYVAVTISGKKVVYQPIDYVGSSELKPGRYTYALSVEQGRLDLEFEVDP